MVAEIEDDLILLERTLQRKVVFDVNVIEMPLYFTVHVAGMYANAQSLSQDRLPA